MYALPMHLPNPCRAAAEAAANGTAADGSDPPVVVKIDNESDPFATVVTVEFGDRLGELLDTVGGPGCSQDTAEAS